MRTPWVSGTCAYLFVCVAGVVAFVARCDDLTAVVRTAEVAHEMRPLRLVTLRTLNGRDRIELPVCRPAATRLRARSFPLEIRHDCLPSPGSRNRRPDFCSGRRSRITRGIPRCTPTRREVRSSPLAGRDRRHRNSYR